MGKRKSRMISRTCGLIMIIFEGREAGIYLGGEICAILDVLSLSGDRYLVGFWFWDINLKLRFENHSHWKEEENCKKRKKNQDISLKRIRFKVLLLKTPKGDLIRGYRDGRGPSEGGVFLLVTVSHAERTGSWSLGYLVNAYHVPGCVRRYEHTLLKQHKVSYNLKKEIRYTGI